MSEADKLWRRTFFGGIFLILSTYGLYMLLGENLFISLYALAGWIVLMANALKLRTAVKKEREK